MTNRDSNETSSGSSVAVPATFDAATLVWLRWPEVWLFGVLSAADIAFTYVLIGHFGHVEGNPVAAYFVEGWGLKGMIWFKLGLMSIILGVCHFVRPHRPATSRALVRLGMLAAAAVVTYSVVLLLRAA